MTLVLAALLKPGNPDRCTDIDQWTINPLVIGYAYVIPLEELIWGASDNKYYAPPLHFKSVCRRGPYSAMPSSLGVRIACPNAL